MMKMRGFTLVESIIVIIVMGLAMITISQFLVPQIARSANPHYQARAAALGQSVLSSMLAHGFDQYSDFTGGSFRCGEGAAVATTHQFCSGTDVSVNPLGDDGELVADYNDVDDFIGCWEPGGANGCKDLNALVGDASYRNFRLELNVAYQEPSLIKSVVLSISALNQTPIQLQALKGNY